MMSLHTIDYLIAQRSRDAIALNKMNRNSAAVYLMGYALELALKRKICNTWNFTNGFPENKAELQAYLNAIHPSPLLGISPTTINDIRNHDLNKLLKYSGAELRIKSNHLIKWDSALNWYVEMRYAIKRFNQEKSRAILQDMKVLILEIL